MTNPLHAVERDHPRVFRGDYTGVLWAAMPVAAPGREATSFPRFFSCSFFPPSQFNSATARQAHRATQGPSQVSEGGQPPSGPPPPPPPRPNQPDPVPVPQQSHVPGPAGPIPLPPSSSSARRARRAGWWWSWYNPLRSRLPHRHSTSRGRQPVVVPPAPGDPREQPPAARRTRRRALLAAAGRRLWNAERRLRSSSTPAVSSSSAAASVAAAAAARSAAAAGEVNNNLDQEIDDNNNSETLDENNNGPDHQQLHEQQVEQQQQQLQQEQQQVIALADNNSISSIGAESDRRRPSATETTASVHPIPRELTLHPQEANEVVDEEEARLPLSSHINPSQELPCRLPETQGTATTETGLRAEHSAVAARRQEQHRDDGASGSGVGAPRCRALGAGGIHGLRMYPGIRAQPVRVRR